MCTMQAFQVWPRKRSWRWLPSYFAHALWSYRLHVSSAERACVSVYVKMLILETFEPVHGLVRYDEAEQELLGSWYRSSALAG